MDKQTFAWIMGGFFSLFLFFFFYLSKRLFCLEPPFNCLWMSFSWFGLMLLVFQMLMPFYTDGKSNFKVHLRCYCVESYNWQVKLGCFCKSADVYKLVLILNSTFFFKTICSESSHLLVRMQINTLKRKLDIELYAKKIPHNHVFWPLQGWEIYFCFY